ncbi:MAG: DUF933 domain-containing protein, partial [Anaerolineaceae bacterium]|nr:DUF933 domain-containing protein [Anaerolineaceae bacterium]
GGRDKAAVAREQALFERLHAALSAETPLRELGLTDDEVKTLSGFGMLSLKPMLIVLTLSEGQTAPEIKIDQEHIQVVSLQGKLEMDIAQLPAEDAALFLEESAISEPSLNRMIRFSYDLLGLQSFFTVGPDEVRAWTVRRGALAPEAAGVIHSDLEKGFIRAAVVTYDDLVELGGLNEAKAKGKLRLEGKAYPVQDGDILNIRFNI